MHACISDPQDPDKGCEGSQRIGGSMGSQTLHILPSARLEHMHNLGGTLSADAIVCLQPIKAGNMLERVTTTTTTVVSTKTEGQYQLEKFAYDPYAKGKAYKTKQVMDFIEQPWYRLLLTSGDIQARGKTALLQCAQFCLNVDVAMIQDQASHGLH